MLKIPDARAFSESERLAQKSDDDFRAADVSTDPAEKDEKVDDARRAVEQSALAAAYTYLQRAVGLIGFSLPIVLVAGNSLLFDGDVKGSISSYYYLLHTDGRRVRGKPLCARRVLLVLPVSAVAELQVGQHREHVRQPRRVGCCLLSDRESGAERLGRREDHCGPAPDLRRRVVRPARDLRDLPVQAAGVVPDSMSEKFS